MPSGPIAPLSTNPLFDLPASPGRREPAPAAMHIPSQAAMPEIPAAGTSIRLRSAALYDGGLGAAAAQADRFVTDWKEFMRLSWPPEAQGAFIRQWLGADESGVELLLHGDLLKKMVASGCRGIGIAVGECLSHKAEFVTNAKRFISAVEGRTDLGLSREQRLELETALLAHGGGLPPIRKLIQEQCKPGGLFEDVGVELGKFYDQAVKVSDDPALVSRLTLALQKKDRKQICTILSEVWDAGSHRSPLQRFRDARGLVNLCIAHDVLPSRLVAEHGRALRQLSAGSGFLVAACLSQNRSDRFDSIAWRHDDSLWASVNGEPLAGIESAAALLADGRLIESVARGRKGVSPLIAHLANAARSERTYWSAISDQASRQRVLALLRELLLTGGVRPNVCAAYLKACEEAFERAYESNSPPALAMAAPAKSTRGGLKKAASEVGAQKKSVRLSGTVEVRYAESKKAEEEDLNLAENTRQPDNPTRRIRLQDQLGWSDMEALKTATPIVSREVQIALP